jgi:superfamily II DNA or RNA helicase
MQELFEAVKEACSAQTWSRGVELVRADSVGGEPGQGDELVLRVSTRGGMVAPVVTLYPDDEDWECTCSSQEDACEHVAAAIIAVRRARKEGKSLPTPATPQGRIRYCFVANGRGQLDFEREIVTGDKRHALNGTLEAVATRRVDGPPFVATQQDIAIERALGSQRKGVLARDAMARLLDALAGAGDIRLGGQPVQVDTQRVGPIGRVVDAPGGVRLFVEQDPSITRVFANGVALCGDTLRAVGASRLTGRELDELPRGRFFAHDQLAELVTEVLPSLRERIEVVVDTDRLPVTSEGDKPRIVIAVGRDDDRLSILPTLVYGTPPTARVDAGRLVHLGGAIPLRDEVAERARVQHLQRELGLLVGRRVTLTGDDAITFADRLAGWRGEITGDAHQAFHRLPELVPRLHIDDDKVQLDFDVPLAPGSDPERSDGAPGAGSGPGAGQSVAADSVLAAWTRGESMVALPIGGFAPLPADWLARFGHRVADLLAARQADGRLPPCVLPDLGRLCEELDEPGPAKLGTLRPLLEDWSGIPPATLPADLSADLRSYQRHGVDWLCFLRDAGLGALLADDMGLGKTVQTLAALKGRSLVVVPTSLLHNWVEEMDRFRPGLRYSLYHGPRRSLDMEADVVLTSYAILRLDQAALGAERWSTVVLDEAQNIKNPDSQVARAAFELTADFRIALTGTPVENRLEELWSQLHFLNRGLLGGRKAFQDRYARPISEGEPEAAERLRERIRPFVMRRLKRDVAPELPPRTEVVLHCELDQSEREVYDAVRAASVAKVVEQLRAGGNMMAALEALLRLRQAACHPGLVPGQSAERSTKVDLLVERLDQAVADGHKALVFSQWTSLLDRVEPALRTADIRFDRLDGSTRDRAGVLGRFQGDDGAPVLLVSLKAGGTGLNLTAADHIFLLDPWWNPAVEDQAADRAHRIGQTRPVVVHRIVAQDTVEERILELHTRKRALSEVALGAAGSGEGLTRDDLLALLSE